MLKVQDGNLQLIVSPKEANWIVVQILEAELEDLKEEMKKAVLDTEFDTSWKMRDLGDSYKYKEALKLVLEVFGRNV